MLKKYQACCQGSLVNDNTKILPGSWCAVFGTWHLAAGVDLELGSKIEIFSLSLVYQFLLHIHTTDLSLLDFKKNIRG